MLFVEFKHNILYTSNYVINFAVTCVDALFDNGSLLLIAVMFLQCCYNEINFVTVVQLHDFVSKG